MKTVSISGSPRVNVGKKDANELRRNGMIPCVVYGGKEQIHFAAPEAQFVKLVYTPDAHQVKLDIGGRQVDAVMKDIQFHKMTDKILHIDFLEIQASKPVVVSIPVKLEGNAPGVKAGGKLNKKMRTLKVKGPIDKMPDYVTLDVSKLEIGNAIKVQDVKLNGLQLLDIPSNTVVSVKVTRNVVEEEKPAAAATAAAPAAAAPAAAAKKPEAKK